MGSVVVFLERMAVESMAFVRIGPWVALTVRWLVVRHLGACLTLWSPSSCFHGGFVVSMDRLFSQRADKK